MLHGISFEAEPGTVTALVGSSGSGKSTIISLLCAFHTPTSGQVLVDGIDLASVDLNTYRSQLGVVLQDSFLFDGSIRENVMFSRPDATEEQFLFACRTARVDEFAERFPEGYDTIVGERGVKLSGGQRQRLSIARALLAQPRILILDEATSSLDSESEADDPGRSQSVDEGTHHICHRPSAVDDSARRPDPGRGAGKNRRARQSRRAVCAWAAAITTSTPASTASKRTCSSLPAKVTKSPLRIDVASPIEGHGWPALAYFCLNDTLATRQFASTPVCHFDDRSRPEGMRYILWPPASPETLFSMPGERTTSSPTFKSLRVMIWK